ncbi:MAG: lysophospholipase L1-like esterase [Gammaproteobacteria bacterium]
MNTLKYFFTFLFVTTLVGCGGGGGSNSGAGGGDLQRRIVVIGDSIGIGYNVSVAFPDLLEGLTGIEVINRSIGGASASRGAGMTPALIEEFKPMYLVVLLGTNNAGGPGGGVKGAIEAINFAARIALQAGVIPIIGTIPPITNSSDENDNVAAINAGIISINGARIARINQAVSPSDISDGTHPTDRGQRIIAQLFAEQVF